LGDLNSHPIFVVLAIAVVASLLAEFRLGTLRVPMIVWEMLFGILIGPQVLGWVKAGGLLQWLGHSMGLPALFFMTGLDLDLQKLEGQPISLALRGWVMSLGLAIGAAALLHSLTFVRAPMVIALVLTTTAMGTFAPTMRDAGYIDTTFGIYVLAAGAVGEFAPIVVVSLVLTREHGAWQQVVLMLAFAAIGVGAAFVALGFRPPKVLNLLERGMHSSTQLPVCFSLLLLSSFDILSRGIGMEAVLGCFTAGIIAGLASRGEAGKLFREKMEAVCYGFLVPFFFVISGVNLDLAALLQNKMAVLLVPLFLILFLLVRGAPVLLYGNNILRGERLPFALYSATALSMVVAIANIAVRTGQLGTDIAAALEGAALLSVLLFPTIAGRLMTSIAGRGLHVVPQSTQAQGSRTSTTYACTFRSPEVTAKFASCQKRARTNVNP
jgi:Kef-type K+ transport system membrane component KefB